MLYGFGMAFLIEKKINLSSSTTVVKKKKKSGEGAVLATSALSFLGLCSSSEN